MITFTGDPTHLNTGREDVACIEAFKVAQRATHCAPIKGSPA